MDIEFLKRYDGKENIKFQDNTPRKVIILSNLLTHENNYLNPIGNKNFPNFSNEKKEPTQNKTKNIFIAVVVLETAIVIPYYAVKVKIYLRKLKKSLNEENFDISSFIVNNENKHEEGEFGKLSKEKIEYIKDKLNIKNDPENLNFMGPITTLQMLKNKREILEFENHINRWECSYEDFFWKAITLEFIQNERTSTYFPFLFSFNSDPSFKIITNFDQFTNFKLHLKNGEDELELTSFNVSKEVENVFLESVEEGEGTNTVIENKDKEKFDKNDPYGTKAAFSGLFQDLGIDISEDSEKDISSESENFEDDVDNELK